MERERMLEEVAKIEAYLASYRSEEGEMAFNTSMGCFRAKPLRSVCVRRGIRAQGKEFRGASTKNHYIAALWEHCRDEGPVTTDFTQDTSSLYDQSHSLIRPAQPTKHCVVRLVNVLFSNDFSHRLAAEANDPKFWEEVAASYCSTSLQLDGLISTHKRYRKLNPSTAEPHPPAKLRDTWNMLCVVYEAACERVLMTDNTSRDFLEVYQGRLDVLYLHEWLRIRPELVPTVGVKLQENQEAVGQYSSSSDASETQSNDDATSETDLETSHAQIVVEVETENPSVQVNDVEIIADTQTHNTDAEEMTPDSTQTIVATPVDEVQMDDRQEVEKAKTRKRKLELLENILEFLDRDAPDETDVKRRRLKGSSEYVQTLFRTVQTMKSAGCCKAVVDELLEEAQRQASKLVRASQTELP